MAEENKVVEQETPVQNSEKKPFKKDFKKPFRKDGNGNKKFEKRDNFNDKVIFINSVSKTVKGGRRRRFSALVAVGDGRGNIGFGMGKAIEVPDAIKKATDAARKHIVHTTIVKGDTISHEIIGKAGACQVFLKPAPVGTGVIAGGPVRAVLELAGVKNIYSKVYGSRTPVNIVRATMNAMTSLKTVGKVAALRGKSGKEILG